MKLKSPTPKKILVLHGPNLNLLGEREPGVYGTMSLKELNVKLKAFAKTEGVVLTIKQSNYEGALIELIHDARKWANGIVINPGAFTHYSYALRDAVASISVPTVEVHLSDITKREKFRQLSVIEEVCIGQIGGLGYKSYFEGIKLILKRGAR